MSEKPVVSTHDVLMTVHWNVDGSDSPHHVAKINGHEFPLGARFWFTNEEAADMGIEKPEPVYEPEIGHWVTWGNGNVAYPVDEIDKTRGNEWMHLKRYAWFDPSDLQDLRRVDSDK